LFRLVGRPDIVKDVLARVDTRFVRDLAFLVDLSEWRDTHRRVRAFFRDRGSPPVFQTAVLAFSHCYADHRERRCDSTLSSCGVARGDYVDAATLAEAANLTPDRLSDAVAFLVEAGYSEWIQTFGTAPFDFADAMITVRGRYESQRLVEQLEELKQSKSSTVSEPGRADARMANLLPARPPAPVGSPYGFTDEDWKELAQRATSRVCVRRPWASGRFDVLRYR